MVSVTTKYFLIYRKKIQEMLFLKNFGKKIITPKKVVYFQIRNTHILLLSHHKYLIIP